MLALVESLSLAGRPDCVLSGGKTRPAYVCGLYKVQLVQKPLQC